MPNPGLPDRISRTHVVPGNIMSVEFKLFDFMTLKQFLYLVVCAALSYLFFGILPDNIFKFLIPGVIMIAGIIIAFVQFNGEPFEVYTTNFILGVIQPQRRVWSKVPMQSTKPTRVENEDEDANYKNAYKSISDNYVTEQEIIPVNFNGSSTTVDVEEKKFLKSQNIADFNFSNNNNNLPKADLSKLNFDFSEIADGMNTSKNNSENINLLMQSLQKNSDTMEDNNSNNNSDTIDTNLDMNILEMNPPKTVFGQGSVSATSPAFTINMDDDDKNGQTPTNSTPSFDQTMVNSTLPTPGNIAQPSVTTTPDFIPLANEKPQSERVNEIPDINLNIGNSTTPIINNTSQTSAEVSSPLTNTTPEPVMNMENFHTVPELSTTPTVNTQIVPPIDTGSTVISTPTATDLTIPNPSMASTTSPMNSNDPLLLGSTTSMNTDLTTTNSMSSVSPLTSETTSAVDLITTPQNTQPDLMSSTPINMMDPSPMIPTTHTVPEPNLLIDTPLVTAPMSNDLMSNPSTNNMEIGNNFSRSSVNDNLVTSRPMMQISESAPESSNADIPNAKIHGRVLSLDLKPITNLAVILFDADAKALESVVTNDRGEFSFNQTPKIFEIKIHSVKRFNFSPMDKMTREIIIQEMPEGYTKGSSVMQMNSTGTTDIITLPDAEEMVNTAESKIVNTVNGLVKDDAGHYLAGVLVSIKDLNGATIRALATNPLGQFFSHSAMPDGTYYINFEKDGYSSTVFSVKLDGRMFNPKVYLMKNQNLQRI